jgi:hypothetical protein
LRASTLTTGLERMLGTEPEPLPAGAPEPAPDAEDVENFVDRLYADPLIAAMVSTSRRGTPRRPSYLDKEAFTTALTNAVGVAGLVGDASARIAAIAARLDAPIPGVPEQTRKALLELWQRADNSEEQFLAAIGTWFDVQMQRVSGWYGRRAQLVMFILALLLAVGLNMSATTIASALWANPALRAAAETTAQNVVNQNSATTTTTASPGNAAAPAAVGELAQGAPPATAAATTPATTATTTTTAPATTTTTVPATTTTTVPTYAQLQDIGMPIGWSATAWPGLEWALALHVVGWFLMALAGSFGAPIWFDLLNKLVNLRVAGPVPSTNGAGG